jgi:hypothetical protein
MMGSRNPLASFSLLLLPTLYLIKKRKKGNEIEAARLMMSRGGGNLIDERMDR